MARNNVPDLRPQRLHVLDRARAAPARVHVRLGGRHRLGRQFAVDITMEDFTKLFAVHGHFTLIGLTGAAMAAPRRPSTKRASICRPRLRRDMTVPTGQFSAAEIS